MPAGPTSLEELLAQIATCIHYTLHPVSTLLGKAGVTGPGLEGLDTAAYAALTWFLGSREGEAARKLGLVLAAGLAALAAVAYTLGS